MGRNQKSRGVSGARPALIFLLKCAVFCGIALWLVSRFPAIEELGIQITVGSLERVFGLLGQTVERRGPTLYTGGVGLQIVADCSPHLPYLIFAAAILAFPASWRHRLLGLLLGALLIHAFNVLRILTLAWVLAWNRAWFDFFHVYLWQTGTIVIIIATFAVWLRATAPRAAPA